MRAAGPERRSRVGPGVVAWGTVALVFAACATPRGGWNVDGVVQRYPRIAEIPGQRLGTPNITAQTTEDVFKMHELQEAKLLDDAHRVIKESVLVN